MLDKAYLVVTKRQRTRQAARAKGSVSETAGRQASELASKCLTKR